MDEGVKAGVEYAIIVMYAVIGVGCNVANALEDGKFGFSDSIGLLTKLPQIISAVNEAKEMPAELSDLDDAERAQITAHFAEKFDLPNDVLEKRMERVFSFLWSWGVNHSLRSLFQSLKLSSLRSAR
ncbi:MAG: hypothetical protein JXR40_06720 [Pontiellaceae bacterium]|nr:hypothetical protein [Pontiellaceae bacterium]